MNEYFPTKMSFEENYKRILALILMDGRKRHVRGFNTLELSPFVLSMSDPLQNIITNPLRKINRAFSVAEWLWMMSGREDVEMISFYNKNISQFSDDGKKFNGAYGPRIKRQLDHVLNSIKADINSRQAVISIWSENPKKSKDTPCTLTFQFLVDNTKLDMIVNMRSNDAWLGLPYDVYNFTMIQNYVAFKLGLRIGKYSHLVASEHLYEEHFDKSLSLSILPTHEKDIQFSDVIQHDELNLLISAEESMRRGQDCSLILSILHEPWKNMAEILRAYCENKHVQTKNT